MSTAQAVNEEETMASLAGEAQIPVNFNIEPEPPRQPQLKVKKKRKLRPLRSLSINGQVQRRTTAAIRDYWTLQQKRERDDLNVESLPKYKVVATATIFGKEYKQIYTDVDAMHVENVKQDFLSKVDWYVRCLYVTKKLGQGGVENTTVKVPLLDK